MVSAAIGTAFVQDSPEAARQQWRAVADPLRAKFPKLSALMDEAEHDVLAFMTFPRAHWPQIYSTNPLERLNVSVRPTHLDDGRSDQALMPAGVQCCGSSSSMRLLGQVGSLSITSLR
jgi:hypothetical protein